MVVRSWLEQNHPAHRLRRTAGKTLWAVGRGKIELWSKGSDCGCAVLAKIWRTRGEDSAMLGQNKRTGPIWKR